jgi:hypothetical protein
MAAINITDLNNAKLDVDHIAEIATSTANTSIDRLGNVKDTVKAAIDNIKAFNSRGAWVTATAYAVKDVVSSAGVWYACVVAHTSSAAFATDSPTKWRIHQAAVIPDLIIRSDYGSDAAFNAAKVGKTSIDSTLRMRSKSFISGDEEISGATVRDGFVVGRNLVGDTNCHGFADRTIISGVTDGGFHGAFDSTVRLEGTHNQNHLYSFQDRATYAGGVGGVLQNSAGFISQAVHSGAGTILDRIGYLVDPMAVMGGGAITSQRGFAVNHLGSAASNVGFWTGQTAATGYAFHAAGGGKSYHLGKFGLGVDPSIGALDFAGSGGVTGFLTSDASSVTFGASGNRTLKWVTGSDVRLQLDATTYTFKPWGDNTQKLGDAGFRWSVVYAGTGTINTSDAREKQQIQAIDAVVMRACAKINFCQFKFNDSVADKGDSARWHFGAIAQDVKAAFESEGLDPFAYGILCFDKWDDKFEHHPAVTENVADEYYAMLDGDGRQVLKKPAHQIVVKAAWDEKVQAAGERYGLRYDELLVLQCACLNGRLKAVEIDPEAQ